MNDTPVAVADLEKAGLDLLARLEPFHAQGQLFGALFPELGPGRNFPKGVLFNQKLVPGFVGEAYWPYLAPEQTGLTDMPVGPETDFYNWACQVIYLAGQAHCLPRFEKPGQLRQVLTSQVDLGWTDDPQWPSGLKIFLTKILSKNPLDRYHSLQGVRTDWSLIWRLAKRPLGELPTLGRDDFPAVFTVPQEFYGRTNELLRLQEAATKARIADGPIEVQFWGPSGSGKSALLQHFFQERSRGQEGWFLINCQEDQNSPYGALKTFLERALLHPLWQEENFRSEVFSFIQLETGNYLSVLSRIVPAWKLWISSFDTSAEDMDNSKALKSSLDNAWAILLRAWCYQTPLILGLDNVEFLGKETRDILAMVTSSFEAKNLAVLSTKSPDSALEPADKNDFKRFELPAFSAEEIGTVLKNLPLVPDQIKKAKETFFSKTLGVPKALRLLWQEIQTKKIITPDPARKVWLLDLGSLENLELPESLASWMGSRLNQLSQDDLLLLQLLAQFPEGIEHGRLNTAWNYFYGNRQQGWGRILVQLVRNGWITRHPKWRLSSPELFESLRSVRSKEENQNLDQALIQYWIECSPPENASEFREFAKAARQLPPQTQLKALGILYAGAEILKNQGAFDRAAELVFLIDPKDQIKAGSAQENLLLLLEIKAGVGDREGFLYLITILAPSFTDPEGKLAFDHSVNKGWLSLGDSEFSLASGLSALHHQGYRLPTNPKVLDVILASIPMQQRLKKFDLNRILSLPIDPSLRIKRITSIMQNISTAAFFIRPLLVPILTSNHIILGLKSGLAPTLAVSFATLAFQQALIFQNPGLAGRTLIWSEEILRKLPDSDSQIRSDFLAWSFIRWWLHPLPTAGAVLQSTAKRAFSLGRLDIGFNCYLIGTYYELQSGQTLPILQKHISEHQKLLELRGSSQNQFLHLGLRAFVTRESGNGEALWVEFEKNLENLYQRKIWNAYFALATLKILGAWMDENTEYTDHMANDLLEQLPTVGFSTFSLMSSMLLSTVSQLLAHRTKANSRLVKTLRARLEKALHNGSTSIKAYLDLLDSCIAFSKGKMTQSLFKISQAIEAFTQNQILLFVALSTEVKARILEKDGLMEIAKKDWKAAYWIWVDLGYRRRALKMVELRPWLAQTRAGGDSEGGSKMDALLRFEESTRLLFNQPSRDAIADCLVNILNEGGAEQVFVFTYESNKWKAWGRKREGSENVNFPGLLFQTAWNKHQPIIYNGMISSNLQDPFLNQFPGSFSIFPLMRTHRPIALVYIENSQLPAAFPERRILQIRPIMDQLAAAFENRSLIDEMEHHVKIRNEELLFEKGKTEALLLNILPKQTAEELKSAGRTRARFYPDVTVMFLDFVNFTAIASRLEPQALVDIIDEFFSEFDAIIDRFGLEKIKTIGDAYMAVGGLAGDTATGAVNATQAAAAFLEVIDRKKRKMGPAAMPEFSARLGLHTGPVVGGVVGTKKFQFDIWGDTVNIAARMEQAGEPGKINISGSTHELVKAHFTCTHRGQIEAKNKGKLDMYFVERPAAKPGKPD